MNAQELTVQPQHSPPTGVYLSVCRYRICVFGCQIKLKGSWWSEGERKRRCKWEQTEVREREKDRVGGKGGKRLMIHPSGLPQRVWNMVPKPHTSSSGLVSFRRGRQAGRVGRRGSGCTCAVIITVYTQTHTHTYKHTKKDTNKTKANIHLAFKRSISYVRVSRSE